MSEPIDQIPVVTLVKILPTAIWIEDDICGGRHVMVQHEGMEAFCYASFHYAYGYTSNSGTWNEAHRLAISLGATEPIESRFRQMEFATPSQVKGSSAPSAEPPDDGELEAWRHAADALLNHKPPAQYELRRAAFMLQNAYTFALALRAAATQGAPTPAQPTEEPQSVARIAKIGNDYPWAISLVWHIAVPDFAKFGIVEDGLLYTHPPVAGIQPTPEQGEEVPCKFGDPACTCQDGDACHYEGPNPMTPPAGVALLNGGAK